MEKSETFDQSADYKAWRSKLQDNQIKVKSVEDAYTHHGKDGQVLYALVRLDAETPEGNRLAPLCFIKGDAVSIVVVLIDEQSAEKSVLLVRQRRVCDGSETYEHPAGMMEEGESPHEVAVRELKEETGLDVPPEAVIPLGSKSWFSATATSDECLFFFYTEQRLPADRIRELHGKSTGKASEGEHTRLEVALFPQAHRLVSNLHGILGHLMYLQAVGDYETMKQLSLP